MHATWHLLGWRGTGVMKCGWEGHAHLTISQAAWHIWRCGHGDPGTSIGVSQVGVDSHGLALYGKPETNMTTIGYVQWNAEGE